LLNAPVAPYAGAWIEIKIVDMENEVDAEVAPYAGAWIEISSLLSYAMQCTMSHPTRVRGLKYEINISAMRALIVAPYAGAWIEIGFAAG
jgi:hypothetical protein